MMSSEITTGSFASTFRSADAASLQTADASQSPNAEIARLFFVIGGPFQLFSTVSEFSMMTMSSVESSLSRSPVAVAR